MDAEAQFEAHRDRLRAVAYRMLGSQTETDDALQESWLRVRRSGMDGVENVPGWLTTIVARVCLNMLRARSARREAPLDEVHLPDPVVTRAGPEEQAVLADTVGLAVLVVLETLKPDERLAFVLHDMFGVPFDEIAGMLGKSSEATRQVASRARRRVHGEAPVPDASLARQRRVVDAFLAASRDGDFDALVAVLHPDVELRVDLGPGVSRRVRGAEGVAGQSLLYSSRTGPRDTREPVVVNGCAGVLSRVDGRPSALLSCTVVDGRIAAIDILADGERLAGLGLTPDAPR